LCPPIADETFMFRRAFIALSFVAFSLLASCSETSDLEKGALYEVYADTASIGQWVDPRAPISQLKLIIDGPKKANSYYRANSTVVITTNNEKIAARVDDIVSGRIPVPARMTTDYSLGGTFTVKIEKIVEGGKRVPLGEGRVNFLEIVSPETLER